MGLTPKQEKFCQEYVKTGNATQSYKIAYPKAENWKESSVNEKASYELNNNVKIMSRVKELQIKAEEKHDITKDKIVKRLQEIIFEQEKLHDGKLDLNAINKSIDTINKMLGYNAPDKIEHSGKIDVNDLSTRLLGKKKENE